MTILLELVLFKYYLKLLKYYFFINSSNFFLTGIAIIFATE